jgi:flagellar hook-basal body complex protein FliE
MQINEISKMMPNLMNPGKVEGNSGDGFGSILSEFVSDVNKSQLDADKAAREYVTGGDIQIQDVMIAGEKAKTSLELLMEIRNKAVDMYKTLTNIQI